MGANDGERESSEEEERSNAGSRGRIGSVGAGGQLQCNCMCYLQEHITDRDSIRASEEEKQKAEEERRKLFVSAKEKMMKLRKDREMELLR